jgi:hypothetical protein
MIGRNEALCKVSMTSDGGTGLRERSREHFFFEGKSLVGVGASVVARTQRITSKGLEASAKLARTITVLASGPILGASSVTLGRASFVTRACLFLGSRSFADWACLFLRRYLFVNWAYLFIEDLQNFRIRF